MVSNIISAISTAIYEEFGDGYEVYKDKVKQGLKEPCFFITCINPITTHFMGKRYKRDNQFCIQYLNERETYVERYEVLNKINNLLEYLIVAGNTLRGTNMSSNIDYETVTFLVNYNTAYYQVEDEDIGMDTLILE